jgi:hypothetical protein
MRPPQRTLGQATVMDIMTVTSRSEPSQTPRITVLTSHVIVEESGSAAKAQQEL